MKIEILHDTYPINLPDNTYVAVDSEWIGMNQNQLHRPISGRFGCMTLCYKPRIVHFIQDEKLVSEALKQIDNCIWVMHNAKFDITQLRRLAPIPPRKKLWDTMLIERILWNGYFELFGLEHLVRRYLNIELDKSLQSSFGDEDFEWSDESIQYSVADTHYTLMVCNEQKKHLTKNDFKLWKEIDRPALWAYLDFMPFRIDVEKWKELAIRNKQRSKEMDKELGFNPRSYQIVKDILKKKGFKVLKNTRSETLQRAIAKYYDTEAAQIARKVIEARKFSTYASRYGMNMIDKFLEKESENVYVLMSDYTITGAETGRSSAKNPNMKNIPARNTKEFRECFIARPGNKIVVIDLSQQEPMITAYLSKDKQLIKATQEEDVYIGTAKIRYKDNTIQKDDLRRGRMKSIFLGLSYGLSAYGLAEREDISLEEAEETIEEFFNVFKGMKRWKDKQEKEKYLVKTVLGRKCYINPHSGQGERNAINSPVQGTANDMMKKALGIIHQTWPFDYPFAVVEELYDELGLDVPEEIAQDVADFCSKIMVDVANEMCPGIKFRVGVAIGDSWAEKN